MYIYETLAVFHCLIIQLTPKVCRHAVIKTS